MATDDQKDTIYIDVDDEITAVIDKVQNSPKKIVALVLPKRATVLQSTVNMKLLKRSAESKGKHVVLVTSEAALLPLAGAVGMFVAKTAQSKPEIPAVPAAGGEPQLDPSESVGKLAEAPQEDSIDVDNSETASAEPTKGAKKNKPIKTKNGKGKLKIPDFNKFRTKLIIGIAAFIVLIIGWVMAFVVLPKATITLQTDTSNIETDITFKTDTSAQEFDKEAKILPAVSKEFRKTDTEKVAATGEKDLGKKATGAVTLFLENCDTDSVVIPAGTAVSTSNLSYVTQSAVTLQSVEIGGDCRNKDFLTISSKTVAVTAQKAGEQYNIGTGKSFSTAGFSAVSGENESAMAGGTSRIVKVVTQADVDKAKDAISKRASTEAPDDLKDDIRKENYYPLDSTMSAAQPTVTSSPAVNAEANEVTVTSTTVFTMVGVKENDLKTLIEEAAKSKIDPETQVIRDNGLADASISVENKGQGGNMTLSLKSTVVAGPDLDEEAIKQEVAGKKRGDIQNLLKERPGINEVEVDYSPFWVQSTPKSPSKITVVFEGKKE